MAFKVICTGANPCYGKENEEKVLGDTHVLVAIKNGWITKDIEYVGNKGRGKTSKEIPSRKVGLPVKKIDVLCQLKIQTRYYKRILEMLHKVDEKRNEILELLKKDK